MNGFTPLPRQQVTAIAKLQLRTLQRLMAQFPDEAELHNSFQHATKQLPAVIYHDLKEQFTNQLGSLKQLYHGYMANITGHPPLSKMTRQSLEQLTDSCRLLTAQAYQCISEFTAINQQAQHIHQELADYRRHSRLQAVTERLAMLESNLAYCTNPASQRHRHLQTRVNRLQQAAERHQRLLAADQSYQLLSADARLDSCKTLTHLEAQTAQLTTACCDYLGINQHVTQ